MRVLRFKSDSADVIQLEFGHAKSATDPYNRAEELLEAQIRYIIDQYESIMVSLPRTR